MQHHVLMELMVDLKLNLNGLHEYFEFQPKICILCSIFPPITSKAEVQVFLGFQPKPVIIGSFKIRACQKLRILADFLEGSPSISPLLA